MQPAHSSRGGRRSQRVPSSSAGLPSPGTALRSTAISRSIETTRTFCSSRWTPRARTRQTTGTAPRRDQPPTPARQPCRLVAHPSELAIVVRPRLRLDREPDAGGIANESMSPRPCPRQRMTQPPPLRPKRRQRAPDLVLRASTHAAAPGEQQPVAGIQAKSEREHEQDSRRRTAPAPATASASTTAPTLAVAAVASSPEPAVLLAPRVVQSPSSPHYSRRSVRWRCWHRSGSAPAVRGPDPRSPSRPPRR
jgi:hypothetical protein